MSREKSGLNHFVDNHESAHALIQEAEFLEMYSESYKLGANFVGGHDKDKMAEVSQWVISEHKHPRGFGLGGKTHPDHDDGQIVVIFCDDEVCVFAADGEAYVWRMKGSTVGQTPPKNKGRARHIAGHRQP